MWLLIAALTCGPLTLMSRWDPPSDLLDHGPAMFAQAFRLANQTRQSEAWFTVAARWDSPTSWPKGQALELETKDGRVIESTSVLAMSPRPLMVPIRLGLSDRLLDPSQLEHKGDRVVLLVSFPDPSLGRGEIADVRIRSLTPRAAASAASRRSP